MKSKLFSSSVLFLIASSSAFAYFPTSEKSCSPIDLRQIFPQKMRDQNDISWCYAFAAADYLQYTYQVPEQVSAADIAISYTQSNISRFIYFFQRIFIKGAGSEPPQTGFVAEAVKRILPQGYCPESVFPSEKWTKVDTATQARTTVPLLDALDDILEVQAKVASGRIKAPNELPFYPDLKNMNSDIFFNLIKTTKRNSLLNGIRNTVCSGSRKPYPLGPISADFNLKGKHVFEKMNANFDTQMPVVIDFFAGVLDDLDHFKKPISDLHTVMVEGRKFDSKSNECYYLIKNSHGEDCSEYDPKIECDKGYLWLSESKMYRSMISRLIIKRL